MQNVTIIGAGRAGGALALALHRSGVEVRKLVYRNDPPTFRVGEIASDAIVRFDEMRGIGSDALILAVADPDIRTVAEAVAGSDDLPSVALHVSGSLSSSELEVLRERGVSVGSMHPLVSISDAESGAEHFAGSYFCIEGDEAARDAAALLVAKLEGRAFSIPTELKPVYHASAVMASGHLTALLDTAIRMLAGTGMDYAEARSVLWPLIESTIANLRDRRAAAALTGPFSRGDAEAVERHLKAFDELGMTEAREVYLALGERSVAIVGGSDRPPAGLDRVAKSISMAKGKR